MRLQLKQKIVVYNFFIVFLGNTSAGRVKSSKPRGKSFPLSENYVSFIGMIQSCTVRGYR